MTTLRFRGTAGEIREKLRDLPLQLAGQKTDSTGAVLWLLRRLALRLQKLTYDAYIVKSEGGTDAMAIEWEPLAEATIKDRGSAYPILIRTRRLVNSFLPESPEGEIIAQPGSIGVRSAVPYFKYHNSAAPRKQKADGSGPVLPRRQITPTAGQMPDEWKKALKQEFLESLKRPEFWRMLLAGRVSG